ncbi:phosphatidylcholine transfer protein-like [Styela clava]|uniref:phosphatidylcholine transfer protein-like n=1 Tax=Styela clava TaxID=7725 RepID=UPI001939D334|nr:phosphatidylcholine transfer protein-like [Styela clava]
MIKLKVLRFMGVLTIMKLGLFAVSAFCLVMALGWILIYCPSAMRYKVSVQESMISDTRKHNDVAGYFQHYEAKLDEELNVLKQREPEKMMEKQAPKLDEKATIPMDKYTDEAFDDMIYQLDHKKLDEFEFLIESMNVTIYRKLKGNGLYEYKLYANLPSATPEVLTMVFLDSDYRLEWDEYVTELRFIQKNEHGPDVVYFNVDFPWPLANRDYVYAREMRRIKRNGKEYFTIIMHSLLSHNIPVKRGVIRVDDFHQMLAVEPVSTGGSRAFIHYYDDPKGSLPNWLINWAAKTGVPGFVRDIQRACKGFEEFKKRRGRA